MRTDEDKKTKDNQAREVSICIAIQFADDVPIIISGERGGRVEIARRGKKGVEVAHVPGGGGEKEKRELPRNSQQPPIVAGRMTQRGGGRYRKGEEGGGRSNRGIREGEKKEIGRRREREGEDQCAKSGPGGWNEVERGVQGK